MIAANDYIHRDSVLELNASDARGIDVVRNKIKIFAQKKESLPPNRQKLVILDEADSMTASAQQALRRTMEIYSASTRFALACNNSTKIIEPIQSRCAVLRFTRLSDAEVLSRLLEISKSERVQCDQSALEVRFLLSPPLYVAIDGLKSFCSALARH